MLVLGIESSCDETAVALVERGDKNRVICEKVKSQIPLHKKYGGVVPEIASRSHYETIDKLMNEVLSESGTDISAIDLISVTQGPGLIGSLLIGLSFAKGLAYVSGIPLVGVDHIQAHIESPFITHGEKIKYPLIALVVSGGHTTIFHQTSKFDTEVYVTTRDDAAGEIMDKVAKFLNLGYPGGPILDKLYPEGNNSRYKFTIPRMSDGSGDFSFSGYKSAALRLVENNNIKEGNPEFNDLISSFMNGVTDYLIMKLKEGIEVFDPESIIIAGGVSRNSLLREKAVLQLKKEGRNIFLPEAQYCTDNAAMIAWIGYEKFIRFPESNYFDKSINSYSRSKFNIRP
ncbi:MAG: tRNA (adenosine(37)-N6)-threonylcarbamoyltransferase complex transferase subunit TsaD [Acidobacteriota bacterium]